MNVVIIEEKPNKSMKILEWIMYMIGYALILITLSLIFPKTLQINNEFFGIWPLIVAILVNLLNRTIKPILVWLTLPITAITLGIFYPFINVLLLQIVDVILGNNFTINGIMMSFIVALLISIMNMLMDKLVIQPLIRKER